MVDNERFSEMVRLVKFYHKINQSQLAERLGCGQSYISDVIRGKKPASDKIMDSLQCMVNEINASQNDGGTLNDSSEPIFHVPLLPIAAQGGNLNDFVTSVKESECEKIISPIKGTDFAITVNGDSMAPEYPNGSQIFIKKIDEQAFIEWGKAYVLDTCNGTVIKILVPGDDESYVKCISINRDPIFAPFKVYWKDIYGVYRVMLCMSVK